MEHELVSDLRLRSMTRGDIPRGMRLCETAGWNQLEDDWRIFLHSPGSGGFLAEREGRVVGSAAFVRYGSLAWIAMMLVDPTERRSGIGSRLMKAVLDQLEPVECVGLDASLMGEPLYRSFGLVRAYDLVRTKATVDASLLPPSKHARRMTSDDLNGVLSRDREVFGADRGNLLVSLFERAPECAWIVGDSAAIRGYTFGRPGRLYHQLGPIVANDRDAASDLVASCLAQFSGKVFAIDAPKLDSAWLTRLESMAFTEDRPFVRMFRQGDAHPGQPDRQYGIAGPEFA